MLLTITGESATEGATGQARVHTATRLDLSRRASRLRRFAIHRNLAQSVKEIEIHFLVTVGRNFLVKWS